MTAEPQFSPRLGYTLKKRGSRACPWLEQGATAAALPALDSRFRGASAGMTRRSGDTPRVLDLFIGQAPNLTASIIWDSCYFSDRRITARASREAPGEGGDEASPQGGDRVRDVPFGSDRRRLWVGNPRERQVSGAAGRQLVLRGEKRRVRRSRSRKRQYTGWRGGGSRATRALHSRQGQALV